MWALYRGGQEIQEAPFLFRLVYGTGVWTGTGTAWIPGLTLFR